MRPQAWFDECRKPVDPVEHLAKALYLDCWRSAHFLMATTVYADASGGNDQPLYVVGGWLASVDDWVDFGREWKDFLLRHNIGCFHQVSDEKHPEDDEWKKNPVARDRIKSEAQEIIRRSGAISMVFFTPTADFAEWKAAREAEGDRIPDCFAWNAFRFVANVYGWCREKNMPAPEFVFEAMSKLEQAQLRAVMEQHGVHEPIFRGKRDHDPARTVVALQAADFLAYEVFRGWKDVVNRGETERPHLREFSRDPANDWSWADKEAMDPLKPVGQAMLRLEGIVRERLAFEVELQR